MVIKGPDNGHIEDFGSTFYMLADNKMLIVLSVLYVVTDIFYNFGIRLVIQFSKSVDAALCEIIKVALIWPIDVIIELANPESAMGEQWTTYSLLQLSDFMLLLFASYVYDAELGNKKVG